MRFSTCCAPAANGVSSPENSQLGAPCITTSELGRTPASGPASIERSMSKPESKPVEASVHQWSLWNGQSVKTTERGGVRGFDGHKRVKGRKRHILVDTLGLPIANRVGPANTSDRRAGARLLAGLSPLFPR